MRRPIVSAINSPTYKLSKWLTKVFSTLPIQQTSFAVKNSLDFIEKNKDLQLQEGELLVSFDVCSLFPSVPIPHVLKYLRHLLIKNRIDNQTIEKYIRLTEICMKKNIFQFNGNFYGQLEGTAMGNSLSSFIADLFISRFEKDFQPKTEYFHRVWIRYVDDVFAIFDTTKCNIKDFVSKLNNRFETIKFTFELEKDGQPSFLDTLVIRNKDHLEFDIYRKDSSTLRYITADSYHCETT